MLLPCANSARAHSGAMVLDNEQNLFCRTHFTKVRVDVIRGSMEPLKKRGLSRQDAADTVESGTDTVDSFLRKWYKKCVRFRAQGFEEDAGHAVPHVREAP